jgi:hypothetical protein
VITRPPALSRTKIFSVASDLGPSLNKFETIVKIKNIATATEDLGEINTLVNNFQNLYAQGDNVNNLTYKIVQAW